ncbi:hypothetical protein GCQ56_08935 [Marinifilum sp. N1E240]|uniref:hypothetical protein n=1 Tax=Marinifilum sp. N1E240 TaxID=2608082 RepID=UPI00128B1D6E|nr:hypothetical protein [Marinifilum sp. N1E240]MPQ47141.1 hypothetical protein [Marinifilum sp. N1E240]
MVKEKDFLVTEEEKKLLRDNAINNELDRLTNTLKRKRKIIVFYRVLFICLLCIIGSFLYLKQSKIPLEKSIVKNDKKEIIPPKKVKTPTKTQKTQLPTIVYYTVYFANENSYPLAQFKNMENAKKFCKALNQMNLPASQILTDSIYRSREKLQEKNYPYRYAVQLGAYNHDILKKYKNNLIWMTEEEEEDYFKYRIAPFYGFSKSQDFTGKIELNEPYILPI